MIAKAACGECVESKACSLDEAGDPICWEGFKPLVVFNKVQESDKITSFYLKPQDGSELPKAKPGQYIGIRYVEENGSMSDVRQYTLSMNSNEDYYRISVKSEETGKVSKGLCSSIEIGSIIESTVPMGVFTLKEGKEPIALIAGGIGVTPILSMALAAKDLDRKVKLIYSVSNSISHSFKEEISSLEKQCSNLEVVTVYTKPLETDVKGEDYIHGGRLGSEELISMLPKDAQYYFCGPFEFMKFVYDSLISMEVDGSRINYEMFDTSKDLTK
ncbi:FAD-binding oxidoreductase [Clostridium sp.]|uniref:FAD-binding oxidoreductase n=1 Tax=Clostridium sp. TaxID=1506 RepID=UPI003FA5E91F